MQIVTPCSPYQLPMTPDTVHISLSVLQLNAMMRQDCDATGRNGIDEPLLDAASECVKDYIQQVGRFAPRETPRGPAPLDTYSLDTQEIFNALQELANRSCGR